MATPFRIFRRLIIAHIRNVKSITKAALALYFLLKRFQSIFPWSYWKYCTKRKCYWNL